MYKDLTKAAIFSLALTFAVIGVAVLFASTVTNAAPESCSIDKYVYHIELVPSESGASPDAMAAYLTEMHNVYGYELVTVLMVQGYPFAHFRRPIDFVAPEPTPTPESGDSSA